MSRGMLKGREGPFQFVKGSRTLGSELADDLADKNRSV